MKKPFEVGDCVYSRSSPHFGPLIVNDIYKYVHENGTTYWRVETVDEKQQELVHSAYSASSENFILATTKETEIIMKRFDLFISVLITSAEE